MHCLNFILSINTIYLLRISIAITITTNNYRSLYVENDDLCSVITRRKVKLLDRGRLNLPTIIRDGNAVGPGALIVRQQRIYMHSLAWSANFQCSFDVVNSMTQGGIFAVIQRLDLRRNTSTDQCIDYVQFTRADGSASRKFCGTFKFPDYNIELNSGGDSNIHNDRMDHDETPAFINNRGAMRVDIFVAKEELKMDENTDFDIVFTAFQFCRDILKSNEVYKACSNTVLQRDYCINASYFRDSIINCPFSGCVDEVGCWDGNPMEKKIHEKFSIGNKVLIGSISTLFIMFGIFIICMWICRSYRLFCWTDNFANRLPPPPPPMATTQAVQVSRMIELSDQSRQQQSELVVDLPNIDDENRSTSQGQINDYDKDLPPSYDSLFPPTSR